MSVMVALATCAMSCSCCSMVCGSVVASREKMMVRLVSPKATGSVVVWSISPPAAVMVLWVFSSSAVRSVVGSSGMMRMVMSDRAMDVSLVRRIRRMGRRIWLRFSCSRSNA